MARFWAPAFKPAPTKNEPAAIPMDTSRPPFVVVQLAKGDEINPARKRTDVNNWSAAES